MRRHRVLTRGRHRAATIGAAVLLLCVAGADRPAGQSAPPAPLRIVLVGDSTVTDDSGWGQGFKQRVSAAAVVRNTAANGRSSKSFIDEGRWGAALALAGDYYFIQFGHNDEPGKGPERETDPSTTYSQNLTRFVDEVRAKGATPILVTSLVRRTFEPANPRTIVSSQRPYVEAMRQVAASRGVPLIDLFASSLRESERRGADTLAGLSARTTTGTVDTTHLNPAGSEVFGGLVADDLARAVPALAGVLRATPAPAQSVAIEHPPDAIVAPDGPATYKTIQEAVNAVPQNTTAARRWTIFVRAGMYRELVYVQREKRFVTLVGEDPSTTTISHRLKASDVGLDGLPIGTFRTPTMVVDADDFAIENMTIENAAGPVGQALALRVDGDRLVVRNSRLLGWQDTLFVDRGRQYFEDTFIAGHVDFIFGGATAFFERCHVHAWRDGYLTAASTPPEARYGLVFADGIITGEPEVRTYLGRPWRDYAQTTFVNMVMGEVVRPAGWHNWDRPEREKTARYVESGSTGPGALARSSRVAWATTMSAAEAAALTPAVVLAGADGWDPAKVPAYPSKRKANAAPLPRPPGDVPAPASTSGIASTAPVTWDTVLRQPAAWYGTPDAARIADQVVRYQRRPGGWPKNIDMTRPLTEVDRTRLAAEASGDDATIDNGSTVTQIRFLALVFGAAPDDRWRNAAQRGIDYLLAAQYTNGGWPQYFPLRADYSSHITFNDDAMIGTMTVLRDVANGVSPFGFTAGATRTRAADAIARGLQVILRTQIRVDGQLTGWCQQYDEATLAPAKARAYEHPSISGRETVVIARYLMALPQPDAATIVAVDRAVAWLRAVEIRGVRVDRRPDPAGPAGVDVVMVDDPAGRGLWARFYELGTNRPIYSGRDGVIKYRLAEIEIERRTGYSWVGPYATALLDKEYPAWQTRQKR